MTTVTVQNISVELTVEQLIAAVSQLEPDARAKVARALAETELDAELMKLITVLYSQSPADDISDADIQAEIDVVRRQGI
ncbi:hypothetical protein GC175_31120 [bacterium]|nr:hypothetical protein [bacterium]